MRTPGPIYVLAAALVSCSPSADLPTPAERGGPESLQQPIIGVPPVLVSLSPGMGSVQGNYGVSITGKNFRSGATVYFDGVASPGVSVYSSTSLYAMVPPRPGASGRATIRVVHPDGKSTTRSDLFYYYSDKMIVAPGGQYAPLALAQEVEVADLNGDGKPDVIGLVRTAGAGGADFGTSSGTDLVVLLSTGAGGWTAPISTTVSSSQAPLSLVTADFNKDGKVDVALTRQAGGDIFLLLGKGDGTFALPTGLRADASDLMLATADVNGDGKPDIAYYVRYGGSGVLLGRGDGTFTDVKAPGMTPLLGPIQAIRFADFTSDGKLDLLVSSYGGTYLVVGNGDGSFNYAAARSIDSSYYINDAVVGDWNGDGKQDVMLASNSGMAGQPVAALLLGNGDGTFAMRRGVGPEGNAAGLLAGDFNGDGKTDLMVRNNFLQTLSLLGNGDGTFKAARTLTLRTASRAKAVDLDGDRVLDIVTAAADLNQPGINILSGDGTGAFIDPLFQPAGSSAAAVKTGDWNGDGKLDAAVANYDSNQVTILLGNGRGTLISKGTVAVGTGPRAIEAADMNGDGKADLIVANLDAATVSVLDGNGDGTFKSARTFAAGGSPIALVIGDFSGDGKLDIATANYDGNNVSILVGNGIGGFAAAKIYAVQKAPSAIAAADLNGDLRLDLIVANFDSNSITVLQASSTYTYGTAKNYPVATSPTALAIADFNADGKPDVAVANSDSGNLTVLANSGAGTLGTGTTYGACSFPHTIVARDFDRDGKMDLAVACDGGAVRLLMGFGDGAFFPSQATINGGLPGSGSFAIGDLDGDSRTDFLLGTESPGLLSVYLNRVP